MTDEKHSRARTGGMTAAELDRLFAGWVADARLPMKHRRAAWLELQKVVGDDRGLVLVRQSTRRARTRGHR